VVDPKPDGLIFDTCKDIPGVSAERRQAFAAGPTSRAVHSRLAAEIGALRDIELQQPPAPAPALGASPKWRFGTWNAASTWRPPPSFWPPSPRTSAC